MQPYLDLDLRERFLSGGDEWRFFAESLIAELLLFLSILCSPAFEDDSTSPDFQSSLERSLPSLRSLECDLSLYLSLDLDRCLLLRPSWLGLSLFPI